MPPGNAGDRVVRRRRARKKDEADPCCGSVSGSCLRLLCAPVSTAGQTEDFSSSLSHILSVLSFSNIFLDSLLHINMRTCDLCTDHTLAIPLPLSLTLSLPLSRSLGAIFTSKPLHYLPSLRAIRNGVTLRGFTDTAL